MTERPYNSESIFPLEDDDYKIFARVYNIAESAIFRRLTDSMEASMLAGILSHISDYGLEREPGNLGTLFRDVINFRRKTGASVEPGYILRLGEFSIDDQLRQLYPDIYPDNTNANWWRQEDPVSQVDLYNLVEEMSVNNLQSNMADGYAIYHILTSLMARHWDRPPVILDAGTSLALGLKKWLTTGFRPIHVYEEPGPDTPIDPRILTPDMKIQELVDHHAASPPLIDRAVGFDLMPTLNRTDEHGNTIPLSMENDRAVRRVFSHTFPMMESLLRPQEVAEFSRLVRMPHDKVTIVPSNIDALNKDEMDRLYEYLPGGKADVAVVSAMLFEHSPEKAVKILENLALHVKHWIFVADFARTNLYQPGGLSFIRQDWWHHPGSFALFGIDLSRPDTIYAPIEIARFITRRATEMWLTPAGREMFLENSD